MFSREKRIFRGRKGSNTLTHHRIPANAPDKIDDIRRIGTLIYHANVLVGGNYVLEILERGNDIRIGGKMKITCAI